MSTDQVAVKTGGPLDAGDATKFDPINSKNHIRERGRVAQLGSL